MLCYTAGWCHAEWSFLYSQGACFESHKRKVISGSNWQAVIVFKSCILLLWKNFYDDTFPKTYLPVIGTQLKLNQVLGNRYVFCEQQPTAVRAFCFQSCFLFPVGFRRHADRITQRQFPHGGYRLDSMDFEDDSRGWRFDMDMVIIYIYSVNWVIGFIIFCFLCYFFFPSF